MPDLMGNMLTPVLGLIVWTCVLQFWGLRANIVAIRKARIDASAFYALAIYSHLVGVSDAVNIGLAWGYVGLQVVHALVLATSKLAPVRFYLVQVMLVVLALIAARNVVALLGG